MLVETQPNLTRTCTCGGMVGTGHSEGHEAVTHSFPYCKQFDRLEPGEFLDYLDVYAYFAARRARARA